MSFILGGMSKQNSDEEVIPVGLVIMSVGIIVVFTAVIAYFILTQVSPQTITRISPAALPAAAENDLALLPETPLEENGDNIVTLSESDQTYVFGQPERLVIPQLDVDAPVSSIGLAQVISKDKTYYQWQVPAAYQAGWHNTSAPLGEVGNTVLNGHHNIHGEIFRDLADLEIGDEIFLYDQTTVHTYTVSLVEILPERDQPLAVRLKNAEWIAPTEDERVTLVTCWPYEDNSHRLMVVAVPAETEKAVAGSTSSLSINP